MDTENRVLKAWKVLEGINGEEGGTYAIFSIIKNYFKKYICMHIWKVGDRLERWKAVMEGSVMSSRL